MSKLVALLSSVRFWIVTLTAVVSILQGLPALEVIQIWAAAVVGIGTLDKAMVSLGGK